VNAISPHIDHARHKANLRRSFRLGLREALVTVPLVQILPPTQITIPALVFLTALFTKAYDLPKGTIGLITALPFACNFLQLAISPFLARWQPPKKVTVLMSTLHLVGWATLGVLLPWLPRADPATVGRWLAWWFFGTSLCGALASVAWNAWMQEWVPGLLRGRYFGRRNRVVQISTLTFLLGSGWVLDRWGYAIPAFQGLIVFAVVLRIASIYWQHRSPTPPPRHRGDATVPLGEQWRTLLAAKPLLTYMVFGLFWSFAANCFGPFYYVFLFERLQLSAFDVGVLATISALGGAISSPVWGRLLGRYGNKSVVAVALFIWQAQNYLWCFLNPGNRNLVYFMWAWGGVFVAGFVLGQFTLFLKLIPAQARNLSIGLNLALISLMAAVAPVCGGATLDWALARWPGHPLEVYHACFLVQPTLALIGTAVLLRIHEPQAGSFSSVLGAVGSIRTLSDIFGLSTLVDYIFYRPWKR